MMIEQRLLGVYLIFLLASCSSNVITWEPDIHLPRQSESSEPKEVLGYLINRELVRVPYNSPQIRQFACVHMDDLIELLEKLSSQDVHRKAKTLGNGAIQASAEIRNMLYDILWDISRNK